MKKIGVSLLLLSLLSACASTNKPAVEERPLAGHETSAQPVAAEPGSAAGATTVTSHQGLRLSPLNLSPLKDPANVLSQRSVYFTYDSFAVEDEYRPLVEAHAKYLAGNPGARVTLEGHADERGSREYNLALGQKRAESVRKMMSLLGVPNAHVEAVSFGEEKPKALGENEEAWKQNRRTDIRYQGE